MTWWLVERNRHYQTRLGFTTTLTLPIIAVPTTRSVMGARPAIPELWLLDQMPVSQAHLRPTFDDMSCTGAQEDLNNTLSASGVPEASKKHGQRRSPFCLKSVW